MFSPIVRRCRWQPLSMSILVLLSACGGGGDSPAPKQPGTVQLSSAAITVDESNATATLTVNRSGGSDGAVSVRVATSNGTATAGNDYTTFDATVSFAAGDAAAKTVTINISNDTQAEPEETFTVQLSAPAGGATLGATTTATVTIRDNDPPPASALTITTAQPRQLTFNWNAAATATSYRVLFSPDGISDYTRVGPEHAAAATSATLDVSVHLLDWINGRYRISACNDFGCTVSPPVSAVDAMVRAIHYMKAIDNAPQIDSPDDYFGSSVAISANGRVLAIGAPYDGNVQTGLRSNGAVYMYVREGSQWAPAGRLIAINQRSGDRFGTSIAMSADGGVVVIGAPSDSTEGGPGTAYVFVADEGHWVEHNRLSAVAAQVDSLFGTAVAVTPDGVKIAVGAPAETVNGVARAGGVYEFVKAGNDWVYRNHLWDDTGMTDADYGSAVALSADGLSMYISAPREDDIGGIYVYVFDQATGIWRAQQRVFGLNSEIGDRLGQRIAVSADGNTLVATALLEDSNTVGVEQPGPSNANDDESFEAAGAVYVFTRNELGVWAQRAYLKASNTGRNDEFGHSVAISADGRMIAVGALGESGTSPGIGGNQADDSGLFAGAAYIFTLADGRWSQRNYVKAANPADGDQFGFSVALSGDGSVLAVGASAEDGGTQEAGGDNTARNSGAAYVY